MNQPTNPTIDDLRVRLRRLNLYGLLAEVETLAAEPWLGRVLAIEEAERQHRSSTRRLKAARLGMFKSIADFDYNWPTKLDRNLVSELLTLGFVGQRANVILIGPNGLGKTMIAKNVLAQALLAGHTARFTLASDMLHDLAAQDSSAQLARRLRRYIRPDVLCIDEVGYLSYDTRYADLLFQVVTRRYQQRSTILTTNKSFGEWNQVFPNASCVVALVDRLVHHAEILDIEGQSYRFKEAQERAALRAAKKPTATKKR